MGPFHAEAHVPLVSRSLGNGAARWRRLSVAIGVVCCFEAGRDGFWLHRLLTVHGVANYVLEPTAARHDSPGPNNVPMHHH